MTLGAMLGAAALLVSTSLPANAFYSDSFRTGVSTTESVSLQKLEVDTTAVAAAPTRDGYSVVSPVVRLKVAYRASGNAYTNNPLGTIQWPFPVPVPIASGFGPRDVSNCGYCTSFHQGVDFTPGLGVAIQSIADGVVSKVAFDAGGYGNSVTIDHRINGQKVQSIYAHMLSGSVRVVEGQVVKVADEVGQVGSSGASTGAHLHLEIHLNGTPIDPFAWLTANAN